MADYCSRLGLDEVAIEALWLLVCCEVEPDLARMVHALGTQDLPDVSVTTWQRATSMAGVGSLSRTAIDRLADLNLIETTREPRLPAYRRWVRAADRVIDVATFEPRFDRELVDIAALVKTDAGAAYTVEIPPGFTPGIKNEALIVVTGTHGSGRATLVRHCAAINGIELMQIECRNLAVESSSLERQLRAVARECRAAKASPLLVGLDALVSGAAQSRLEAVDRELVRGVEGPAFATASSLLPYEWGRSVVAHAMAPISAARRRPIWSHALAGAAAEVIEEVAAKFALSPGAIEATAGNAMARVGEASRVSADDVREGLRAYLDDRLGAFATRIESSQTWDDLVLPVDQFEQVAELVARVRNRETVLDEWGFGDKIGRGHGIAALFSGPPGTGKTMVAGLVAGELGLDLYQVDTSKVVSKYIGETEQNLRRVFDAAETGHVVILFDEADSLFAKRSEVKSSNDRYANQEVNYLLQRIEQFHGICILTTNHETSLDEAVRRRLSIHVRIPTPAEAQRELLWRALLPERAKVAGDIDYKRLAQFSMSGGYIRNAVLRAAYLAADAGQAITMARLAQAARSELESMGRVVWSAT